jgi:hypothetical protein
MSTKTLARAAYHGHRVEVGVSPDGPKTTGYLVGMDDFHLKIVEVPLTSYPPTVTLVPKRVEPIRVHGIPSLEREDETTRQEIEQLGRSFWDYCGRKYLGMNDKKESQ